MAGIIAGNQAIAKDVTPFGNGKDGAFSETSGTTNITQGDVQQFTSFLLDTSATLSASSTSTKPIIILVDGNATINGTVDLTGKGNTISFDAYIDTKLTTLTQPRRAIAVGSRGGFGEDDSPISAKFLSGISGSSAWNFQNDQQSFIMNGTAGSVGGTLGARDFGGGGGASSSNDGNQGDNNNVNDGAGAGAGGDGGCTFFMLIRGNLTFGASSTISTDGADGSNGTHQGGGGGGAGDILIFFNGTLTDNGVTTDVTGGAGGLDSTDGDSDGGAGGAGISKIVAYDTVFWGAGGYPTT